MVKACSHLHFNGNCLAALKFYEKCLNGKISFAMTWGESPEADKAPSDWSGKIMHASIEFDGQMLIADDGFPGSYEKPQGFDVLLSYEDVVEAERVFKALSANGTIKMPFAKTFWAEGFAMFTDQFGTPWMINCSQKQK